MWWCAMVGPNGSGKLVYGTRAFGKGVHGHLGHQLLRYPHSTGAQVALDFNNAVSRSNILEGPSYAIHEYRHCVDL
jgi:hypothetical protein